MLGKKGKRLQELERLVVDLIEPRVHALEEGLDRVDEVEGRIVPELDGDLRDYAENAAAEAADAVAEDLRNDLEELERQVTELREQLESQ